MQSLFRRWIFITVVLATPFLAAQDLVKSQPIQSSGTATLKVGDVAPEFECLDSDGRTWNSKEFVGKKMMLVYFYPSDFSFCCTRQALRYQERLGELECAEVEVVGISCDQVLVHQTFKNTHGLGFFLLSDEQGSVARKFGVPLRVGGKSLIKDSLGHEISDSLGSSIQFERQFTAARWTFLINKDGRIAQIEKSVSPMHDCKESLQTALQLASK